MKISHKLLTGLIFLSIFSVSTTADLGPKSHIEVSIGESDIDRMSILNCEKDSCQIEDILQNDSRAMFLLERSDSSGIYGEASAISNCSEEKCIFSTFNGHIVPSKGTKIRFVAETSEVIVYSDIVERKQLEDTYTASVQDGKLEVERTSPNTAKLSAFLTSAFITVLLESLAILFFMKLGWRSLKLGLIINTITLPVVWFGFTGLFPGFISFVILSELFALLSETILLFLLVEELQKKEAFMLSLKINAISLIFGNLLLFFIWAQGPLI